MEEFASQFNADTEASKREKNITDHIVDAAFSVHRTMGPGLLESIYQDCLAKEFLMRNIPFATQVNVPLIYKGQPLNKHFILDMLVADEVVVEIKAVAELQPIHEAQLLSYLKLTNKKIGYLLNFKVPLMKNGIRRMRNGY